MSDDKEFAKMVYEQVAMQGVSEKNLEFTLAIIHDLLSQGQLLQLQGKIKN